MVTLQVLNFYDTKAKIQRDFYKTKFTDLTRQKNFSHVLERQQLKGKIWKA